MKVLKVAISLFEGKKRALGGLAYVLLDMLQGAGKLDPTIAFQLKAAAAGLLGIGVGDALWRAK